MFYGVFRAGVVNGKVTSRTTFPVCLYYIDISIVKCEKEVLPGAAVVAAGEVVTTGAAAVVAAEKKTVSRI